MIRTEIPEDEEHIATKINKDIHYENTKGPNDYDLLIIFIFTFSICITIFIIIKIIIYIKNKNRQNKSILTESIESYTPSNIF